MKPHRRPRSRVSPLLLVFGALATWGCQSPPGPPTVITSSSASVLAQRSVSVTGTADVKVAPDEFVVSVGVDNYAVEAQAAKHANDQAMGALLNVTVANKIDPKDVRTENFTLQPRYDGTYENRHVVGFDAKKTLVVTLHEIEKVETLLTELFKGGANRIDGVSMTSTKIIAERKQARAMAVTAAREKAEAMAATLGQKLGRPLKIDEDPGGGGNWGNRYGNVLNAFDNNNNNEARPVVGEAMATGKIRVTATVAVTFELVD